MNAERLVTGRYQLAEEIGSGGMGVVWRAIDTQLGRPVALKRAREPGDPEELKRMRREARHAGSLRHEHVVTLHDLVVDDDGPWLVMEYVPSPSLAEMVEAGPLAPQRVARIGAQIAEALAEAHRIGLVHRDVKPGNVLFSRLTDGRTPDHAKLTDFGISHRADNATLTNIGGSGTPAYMSPEVARDEPATPVSDVFSLGSTLYAAVFGSPPFGATGNPLMILRRVEACAVEIPRDIGPLGPVLTTLLAREPADRPTATRAAELLRAAAGDTPPETEVRSRPRWPLAVTAAALVAVAVAAVVVVVTRVEPIGAPGADPAAPGQQTATPTIRGLGEVRTADPCALTDPEALRGFGETHREDGYGGFRRCDVIVGPASGARVEVKTEFFDAAQPGAAADVSVGSPLRGTDDGQECSWTIPLPDRNQVKITARQVLGESANRCEMAGTATQSAIAVLRRDVPRRPAQFPPNSLAQLDACTLPGAAALTRVPGLDPTAGRPSFANWECQWDGDARDYHVLVSFRRDPQFTDNDGRRTQIGDREVRVEPGVDPEYRYCQAKVVHRPYRDGNGNPRFETVIIEVRGPVQPEQLCLLATGLATPVAEALPAP